MTVSEPVGPIAALVGMAQQAAAGMGQVQATMMEASRPPRFEYALVRWEQVNDRAREGWQLAPVLGPLPAAHPGEWAFVMQRQLGAADEAAEMLLTPCAATGPGDWICGRLSGHDGPHQEEHGMNTWKEGPS